MTRLPRILPLIGIAIGGVLAINALAGARNIPDLINGAKAFAEGAAKVVAPKAAVSKAKPAKAAEAPQTTFAASPLPPDTAGTAVATAAPAPMAANADALCLASRAGLSPAEMKMIQDLQTRRGELDERETDLDTQLTLVEAAEAKLNGKLDELAGLKGDINNLLGQVDDKQAAETARLVKVYTNMKPQQAAAALATMDDSVRLPIAAGMKEAILGAVMDKMTATDAKELTEKLANRFASAKAVTDARVATAPPGSPLAQQAAAPPAAQPAKAATPAAKPKPAPKQTAANTRPKTTPAPAAKPADASTATPAAAPPPATG